MKTLRAATLILILAPGLCLAQQVAKLPAEEPAQAKTLKATSSALVTRALDQDGDDHERFVLEAELARLSDRLGDFEEQRLRRAFLRGRRGTLAARIAREVDAPSDQQQTVLATNSRLRRDAATARLRDFSGDKSEVVKWRRDYVRFGPSRALDAVIVNRNQNPAGAQRYEWTTEQRQQNKFEQRRNQSEEDDERHIWREDEDGRERVREREVEDEVDDLEDGGERKEERDAERKEESETEKAIQSEDEVAPE